jgi:hypothetical protein
MCYTVLELPVCWNRLGMSMSNENQTTAIVEGETLIYQRGGRDYRLRVGSSAWYAWLQTAKSFLVHSALGTFTVRREQAGNQRGDWYWRAYRKRGGKLQRVYVGKVEEVTLQRLHAVARQLFAQGEQEVRPEAQLSRGGAAHHHRETILSSDQPTLSDPPPGRGTGVSPPSPCHSPR